MITEQELRAELSQISIDPARHDEAVSYLAGFLVVGGELGLGRTTRVCLSLRHTESVFLAYHLLGELYGYRPEIGFAGGGENRKSRAYQVELPTGVGKRLMADCRMLKTDDEGRESYTLGGSMRWVKDGAYCCALYLEGGRLYTGEDYRLDLVLPFSEKRQKELEAILTHYEVRYSVLPTQDKLRLSMRREAVATFLALIGASTASLAVTEYYFERNVNRSVTRTINCSTSNMDKAYKAATHQLWAIATLKREEQYNLLPREVREVGDARLANPEAPLQAIADALGVNKTAVYRRMKVITDRAARYKGE